MRGIGVRTAAGGVLLGLVVALLPGPVAQARPRDPSDGEITAAQAERAGRAAAVGRLTALVAKADADTRRATDQAELAVEKYNKAVVDLGRATARARATRAAAARAERAVVTARAAVSTVARGSYIQGNALASAAALVDSSGPAELLQRAALLRYLSERKLAVVSTLDRAKVRQANADAAARAALATRAAATRNAAATKLAAVRAAADARGKLASLRTQKATLDKELTAARIRLNGLVAERRHYRAWQHAQAVAAAREKARLRALRAAAARRHSTASVPAWSGSGGSWTAAKGQWVADAALRWLGTPYAWGAGDANGPTYGVNGPDGGWNDGSVFGFDCSGLALWAWAQVGIYLPHYSGYQYFAGRHIDRADLMPGDLLFWAYDGSDPGSIHHVAIYLGGGRVVQAPQSGDVVRISPMWFDGYLGAARPGT
jgi:peptidoglycan DL-endopeptidase RipA